MALASAAVTVLRSGVPHPRLAAAAVLMGIVVGVLGGVSNAIAIGVL